MPVAYIIDTIAESKSKTKLFPARSTESAYVNGLIQERVSRSKENTLSDTLFSEYSYLRSSPDHWVRLVQQELIFEVRRRSPCCRLELTEDFHGSEVL
jgi:hypothetical protein